MVEEDKIELFSAMRLCDSFSEGIMTIGKT
jgi:hypothetical protein